MKRPKYLLLAFFFVPMSLLAIGQNDSLNLVFRLSGGYADVTTSTEMGVLGKSATKTSTGVIDFTVGLLIRQHFEMGLGIEYQKQKIEDRGYLFVPSKLYADEFAESNVKAFLGKFYAASHWRLFNRLYFAPKYTLAAGKASGTVKSSIQYVTDLKIPDFAHITNSDGMPVVIRTEDDIDYSCFAVAIIPAFNFQFTKHFALTLETGAFQLSTVGDNHQWLANISPVYWNLGFIVVL